MAGECGQFGSAFAAANPFIDPPTEAGDQLADVWYGIEPQLRRFRKAFARFQDGFDEVGTLLYAQEHESDS